MKVLIIGLYNKLGGIEKCIYDYISHMNLTGISIGFVGAPEHVWFEEEFRKLGCLIHPVCERRNVFRYYKELCGIIKENRYDIVHINMLSCANCIPVIAALKCGSKVICHSHNSAIPSGSAVSCVKKILHRFNRHLVRKADVIKLSCSKDAGTFFYGKTGDFTVLANAIDTVHFTFNKNIRIQKRKELGLSDKDFVIGQVGRFEYQKNHEFSLRFFAEFLKRKPDSFLLLIGTGSLEDLCKKKVKELDIEKNVLFCGQQSDTAPFLFTMDIFLFPSLFEGLSVAGVEAQCSGLPLVASSTISQEMKKTDLVSWCDLSAPLTEWISAVEECSGSLNYRADYAKQIAEQGFDISSQAENLRHIYESCMEASK